MVITFLDIFFLEASLKLSYLLPFDVTWGVLAIRT